MDNNQWEAERIHAEARNMDRIVNTTTRLSQTWTDNDYGPMIEHQLAANLSDDLVRIFPNATDVLKGIESTTFGQLLFQAHPPVPALLLIKEFAKQLGENAWLAFPEEVANVLYYASIAAAELHAHATITQLPREEVIKGYRWSQAQAWIPTRLKELFENILSAKD